VFPPLYLCVGDLNKPEHNGFDKLSLQSRHLILSMVLRVFIMIVALVVPYGPFPSFQIGMSNPKNHYEVLALDRSGPTGMACVAKHCSRELGECLSDRQCARGMGCFVGCVVNPQIEIEGSCQVRCMDLYQNENLDKFTDCTLTRNKCYETLKADNRYPPLPGQLWDEKIYANKDLKNELDNLFRGTWYVSGGLNPSFDTFDCQIHIFFEPGRDDQGETGINKSRMFGSESSRYKESEIIIADAIFRYRVSLEDGSGFFTKSGGKRLSVVTRKDNGMTTAKFDVGKKWGKDIFSITPDSNTHLGIADSFPIAKPTFNDGPPKLILTLRPPTLNYADEWTILSSSGKLGYMVVAYRGTNAAWDGYGGLNLYTREPVDVNELRRALAAPGRAAESGFSEIALGVKEGLAKVGLDLMDLVPVDNSCK